MVTCNKCSESQVITSVQNVQIKAKNVLVHMGDY